MSEVIILGAGISGLSAGYYLGKNLATVYEANNSYGGLCDNFSINNFRFDVAVHLSFTNSQVVRNIFDKTDYITHKPIVYNYYNGCWIKHPVQNNLNSLPIDERIECIKSFISRTNIDKDIDNYEEWLYEQYGCEIAEKFPKVYTRKYWADEAKNLETKWIGNRMYRPTIDEVLYGAMSDATNDVYYAKEVRYPKQGGYKSFLKPLADGSNIKLNKRAVCIDTTYKYVEFQDGEKVYYDRLISSIPLPELIKIMKNIPLEVLSAADKLIATSMKLVSVGFKRPDVAKYLWFYIYNEEMHPARVYSPNLKSPDNVPNGYSSLQFEIYESKHRKINLSNGLLCEHIEKCIEDMKIADKEDILFMQVNEQKYANVVYHKDIYRNRDIVHEYLKSQGIEYIGRFGEWGYLWSDQSLLSGMNVIKKFGDISK